MTGRRATGGASDPPTRPTGLAERCLRQASHDARGHLNNVAIVHELLRTQGADARLLAMAGKSIAACVGVLEQMSALGETLAPELQDVRVGPIARAALAARENPNVTFENGIEADDSRRALSCPERLGHALRALLDACERSLPRGGTATVGLGTGEPGGTRLTVRLRGELAHVPAAGALVTQARVDATLPDWFAVSARFLGVGADLHFATLAPDLLEVCATLPGSPSDSSP